MSLPLCVSAALQMGARLCNDLLAHGHILLHVYEVLLRPPVWEYFAIQPQRLCVILDAVVEDGGLFRRWRHAPGFLISCIGVLHEGVGGDGFFSPPLLLAQRYSLF